MRQLQRSENDGTRQVMSLSRNSVCMEMDRWMVVRHKPGPSSHARLTEPASAR